MGREDHAAGRPADDRCRRVFEVGEEVQHSVIAQLPVHREGAARIEGDTGATENARQEGRYVAPANGEEPAVVVEHPDVRGLLQPGPIEMRRGAGRRVTRVGYAALEVRELTQPSLPHFAGQLRLAVAEVGEGRGCRTFLA